MLAQERHLPLEHPGRHADPRFDELRRLVARNAVVHQNDRAGGPRRQFERPSNSRPVDDCTGHFAAK